MGNTPSKATKQNINKQQIINNIIGLYNTMNKEDPVSLHLNPETKEVLSEGAVLRAKGLSVFPNPFYW